MNNRTPTIEYILDKNGNTIEAKDFFKDQCLADRQHQIFMQRAEVEKHIQQKEYLYVCVFCKQPIKIAGGGEKGLKSLHFKHLKDSEDCHIKTNSKLTEEEIRCIKYNGVKESNIHFELKHFIGDYLKYDSKALNVEIDQVYKSQAVPKTWKKPDVLAELINKKIAFEIQLSTTFLSVIVARNEFYRKEGIFIIWIFNTFSVESDLQPFTHKDIYHNTSFNVFVLDKEAMEKSVERKELILKCYYKYVFEKDEKIYDEWRNEFITIHDLTYNMEDYKALFYNSDEEKEKIIQQRNNKKEIMENNVEQTREYLRNCYRENVKPNIKDYLVKTQEEFSLLSKKFNLNQENKLRNILSSNKINFIRFIFENRNLTFNENLAFLEILKWDNEKPWKIFLCLLSERGFQPSQMLLDTVDLSKRSFTKFLFGDRPLFNQGEILSFEQILELKITEYKQIYLCLLFEKGYQPTQDLMSSLKCSNLDDWSFCKLLTECQKTNQCFKLIDINNSKILNVLYSLLSLRENCVIGFKFNNFIQISNNILEYYKEYGELYLKALKIYHKYDDQLNNDNNGKLKKKIANFNVQKIPQKHFYDEFIKKLFPELFNS